MADGRDLSRTLEGGHEPFYEFNCSLCEDEGRHVEAARYCEECFVYMCDPCVKSHNRIPLNRRHKLLTQGEFTAKGQSALKSFPTKRCLKHPGELINIFCGDHEVVCCSVCKALKHSNCTETQHLPNAAKGILSSREYQIVRKETQVLLSDVLNTLAGRKADISYIPKAKQQVKQTIADFRKKVNKYFDDLEQKSLNKLNLKEASIVSGLEQDRKFLNATKREAEEIMQQLNTFTGENECELFCQVKTGKRFVRESQKRVLAISSTIPESIVFTVDTTIEKYLSSLITLGSFDDIARPTSISSTTHTSSVQSAGVSPNTSAIMRSVSSQNLQVPSGQSDNFIKYKTKLFGSFDVKEKSDKGECYILDICQLPDGNILITDSYNYKLKRLDHSYKPLDSIQLPDEPYCVRAAGSGEAAVSLYKDKKIQIISVGRKLSLTRSFRTENFCRGMVYTANKIVCMLWFFADFI